MAPCARLQGECPFAARQNLRNLGYFPGRPFGSFQYRLLYKTLDCAAPQLMREGRWGATKYTPWFYMQPGRRLVAHRGEGRGWGGQEKVPAPPAGAVDQLELGEKAIEANLKKKKIKLAFREGAVCIARPRLVGFGARGRQVVAAVSPMSPGWIATGWGRVNSASASDKGPVPVPENMDGRLNELSICEPAIVLEAEELRATIPTVLPERGVPRGLEPSIPGCSIWDAWVVAAVQSISEPITAGAAWRSSPPGRAAGGRPLIGNRWLVETRGRAADAAPGQLGGRPGDQGRVQEAGVSLGNG
ncbi:uncharacterized protein THITE_115317 [Thermothielavioides terrestris NRRL 8126]|uniref:Uncharacterized protein n=1 Tax=Thermothielavioides terrestris (strain ATCC 38088 / NRRL 8126) TaxID=578455 RepID=G2RD82_THETT|nr:uncharacterized protein THITE_115317 [Thermothielavioides terrestris NRRL 8126]AEO69917.1 hypothetical protein THITE_115317 [Thermothielavioides terrestris NRRL 8126]